MIRPWPGLLLALAVSLGARAAAGAVNQWTPAGPFDHGGAVTAVAVAPSDPSIVYAGTISGVFRSADAGASWSSANDGLTSLVVTHLAVDPGSASIAYAVMYANGLYKTTNFGKTWTRLLYIAPEVPDGSIAIDPTDPRVLYFGSQGQIRKSADGGATWTTSQEFFGGMPVADIAIDPRTPSTVYAAAGAVYRSPDGGVHWTSTGLADAHAVRIAPDDSSRLYAATLTAVFVSHDGAQTWTAGGAVTGTPEDLAVDPASAQTVYVTFVGGVLKSTDGAASWQHADAGLPVGPGRCLYPITAGPDGTLYTGNACSPGGLFRSTDGAGSWTNASGEFAPVEANGLAATVASPAVYAATDAGVFRSLDRGSSWLALNGGLTDLNVQQLVPNPADSAVLYARTTAAVFKTSDGGETWTDLRDGAFNVLSIAPSAPSTLYAGSADGSFWKTTDAGVSWQSSHPFDAVISSLAVDPRNAATVLAGTEDGAVFRSTDGGATWTAVITLLPVVNGMTFSAIVFAPGSPDTVYAGWFAFVGGFGRYTGGVLASNDGGATWGGGSSGIAATAIAVDPLDASTVYAGTALGFVERSTDGGATYERVNAGLPAGTVTDLAIHPLSPATVYAAVSGFGVFRADFVSCANDGTALCLGGGRFRVEVDWQRTPEDPAQKAHAEGVSTQSGDFWFADPDSVELVVKVLDGRSVNGFFWVFYGAMTDRGFTITVTDRETGAVKTYTNEPGHVGSRADTAAFAAAGEGPQQDEADDRALVRAASIRPKSSADVCAVDAVTLCLNNGRFRVQVGLPTSPTGPILAAPAVVLTPDSGAFAFKDFANLEVAVKVLDGTFVNGHYWVFVGGLSDSGFEVTITDTTTGIPWTYFNPTGVVQSHADTSAF